MKQLAKELHFFQKKKASTQNQRFFDSHICEIPGTGRFFDCDFLKYLEPVSSLILFFFKKNPKLMIL
jgi:hypothetical protein